MIHDITSLVRVNFSDMNYVSRRAIYAGYKPEQVCCSELEEVLLNFVGYTYRLPVRSTVDE